MALAANLRQLDFELCRVRWGPGRKEGGTEQKGGRVSEREGGGGDTRTLSVALVFPDSSR